MEQHYQDEIAAITREAEITEMKINWFLLGFAAGFAAGTAFVAALVTL